MFSTSKFIFYFFQYLKDRDKGKYSMISGKKIKMKLKKSKKDKQVKIRVGLCVLTVLLPRLKRSLFHSSGIKIGQNFWSS